MNRLIAAALLAALVLPAQAFQRQEDVPPGWFILGLAEMKPAPISGTTLLDISELGEIYAPAAYPTEGECDAAREALGPAVLDSMPEIRAAMTSAKRLVWLKTSCTAKPEPAGAS